MFHRKRPECEYVDQAARLAALRAGAGAAECGRPAVAYLRLVRLPTARRRYACADHVTLIAQAVQRNAYR